MAFFLIIKLIFKLLDSLVNNGKYKIKPGLKRKKADGYISEMSTMMIELFCSFASKGFVPAKRRMIKVKGFMILVCFVKEK